MDLNKISNILDIISKLLKLVLKFFGKNDKSDNSSKIELVQDENTNLDDLKKLNKKLKELT